MLDRLPYLPQAHVMPYEHKYFSTLLLGTDIYNVLPIAYAGDHVEIWLNNKMVLDNRELFVYRIIDGRTLLLIKYEWSCAVSWKIVDTVEEIVQFFGNNQLSRDIQKSLGLIYGKPQRVVYNDLQNIKPTVIDLSNSKPIPHPINYIHQRHHQI